MCRASGCFQSFAILNTAAINIGVQVAFCILVYIPLGICLGVASLDYMEGIFLLF
jgi:hypothetical protein